MKKNPKNITYIACSKFHKESRTYILIIKWQQIKNVKEKFWRNEYTYGIHFGHGFMAVYL